MSAAPNNGMHPTADTPALIHINRPGRRVMRGVMLLRLWQAGNLKTV